MIVLAAVAVLAAAPGAEQPTPPPVGVSPASSAVPRDGVSVHFLAYHGEEDYRVSAGGQQCETPCTLVLKPGPARFEATGSGELKAQMVVPHSTSQVRVYGGAPRWYTPTGAVFVPLGIVIGASLWAVGLACGFSPGSGGCMAANFAGWPLLGLGLMITGAVLLHLGNRSAPADANRPEIVDDPT